MDGDELLHQLASVARDLAVAIEPPGADRLLGALAETARRMLGAQACSLALLSEDGSELVYTTVSGTGAEAVTGLRIPSVQGITGWVVQSGQPVAVSDVQSDPRFAPDIARSTGYFPQTLVAAPVVSERGVLGVLSVLDRDADRPGADDDLLLLQVFCDQAAIALETAHAQRNTAELLLTSLADAADSGSSLASELRAVADARPHDDLAPVAALLARLGEADPHVRELALVVLTDIVAHAEQRRSSRPGG